MHNDIKSYRLFGEIDDAHIEQTKERLIHSLEDHMRLDNHVPVLDIDPQFTLDYKQDREIFEFCLTLYGVEVDEEEVESCAGMMEGRKIMRHTHLIK